MKWRRRLPAIVVAALFLAVTVASPALADPLGDAAKAAVAGQSNPMLSWIQMSDAHGVSVWQYELSIDRGNPVTAADKWFWSKLVDQAWQFYRDGVVVAVWQLRWVLDFGWLDAVTAAVTPIGAALHTTMGMLGLVAFFLTISAVVGGFYILSRRTATGVWELMVAVVVAAAVGTVLANPAGLLLNKPDGLAYRVHDTSLQFVAAMSQQSPQLKSAGQTDVITSDLIETFLRQPLELVNFGQVIDGTSCEAGYDDVLKSGPHAWGNEIRDKVTACSASAGEWASAPSPAMFSAASALYPAVFIVLSLALAIGGAVLMAGLNLAWLSIKATVTTIAGVLPGAARRPLIGTIADVAIALGTFVFSFVFLAIFLKAVQLVLGGSGDMSAPQRIFVTDVFLVAGLIIFMVTRKRIKESAHRLRELLSRRPGSPVSAGPAPTRLNTAAAVSAAANVAHLARSVMRRGGGRSSGSGLPVLPRSGVPAGGDRLPVVAGGEGASGGFDAGGFGGGSAPRRPSGGGGGVLVGRVLTGAVEVGLGHATGGASTVAISAVRVLRRPKPRPELPGVPRAVGGGAVRAPLPAGPSSGPGGGVKALPAGPSSGSGGVKALPPGPSGRPSRQVRQMPAGRGVSSRPPTRSGVARPAPAQVRRTGRRGGR